MTRMMHICWQVVIDMSLFFDLRVLEPVETQED